MKEYFLTVFSPSGEQLLNEAFTAANDEEAKETAAKKLAEGNYEEATHRLTSAGKLLMFHV